MNATTCLAPLPKARAEELLGMFRTVQNDPAKALALDAAGRVTGVVPVDDPAAERLLGDLDVHA